MKINIRSATVKDAEKLALLLSQLFMLEKDFQVDNKKQVKALKLLIEDPNRGSVFVAEKGNDIIGMVTAQLLVSTAIGGLSVLLEDLFVEKQYRTTGIGLKLVDALINWGKSKGALRVQLVADKTNEAALKFYSKTGFDKSRMVGLYKEI